MLSRPIVHRKNLIICKCAEKDPGKKGMPLQEVLFTTARSENRWTMRPFYFNIRGLHSEDALHRHQFQDSIVDAPEPEPYCLRRKPRFLAED